MDIGFVDNRQLLFEETVQLTSITEYGYPWNDLVSGKTAIPPGGLRFDIYFKGSVSGEKLRGTIEGVDFLEVRADGKFILNLQATLQTDDGASIKITERGLNNKGKLTLYMSCYSADLRYKWLNTTELIGSGDVDFSTGKVFVKAYLP